MESAPTTKASTTTWDIHAARRARSRDARRHGTHRRPPRPEAGCGSKRSRPDRHRFAAPTKRQDADDSPPEQPQRAPTPAELAASSDNLTNAVRERSTSMRRSAASKATRHRPETALQDPTATTATAPDREATGTRQRSDRAATRTATRQPGPQQRPTTRPHSFGPPVTSDDPPTRGYSEAQRTNERGPYRRHPGPARSRPTRRSTTRQTESNRPRPHRHPNPPQPQPTTGETPPRRETPKAETPRREPPNRDTHQEEPPGRDPRPVDTEPKGTPTPTPRQRRPQPRPVTTRVRRSERPECGSVTSQP